MDSDLICNFKHCRKPLNAEAWVTSCSHVFCDADGTRELQKAFVCPACDTPLPGKYDAVRVDLNPSEQYKSMVLAGQKPEVILEICTRAMTFWTYQIHQEIVYQEYISNKAQKRQCELEKYYETVVQKAKNEISLVREQLNATKKELEATRAKASQLAEKLVERGRQYQQLQRLYEALRRKFVSPAYFEKKMSSERPTNAFDVSSANDILLPKMTAKSDYGDVDQQNFVLRPVPTPTPGSTQRFHPFEYQRTPPGHQYRQQCKKT